MTALENLFDAMKNGSFDKWDNLPTFGGKEPADTCGVWSWDETRQIVGTCAEDILIENRND